MAAELRDTEGEGEVAEEGACLMAVAVCWGVVFEEVDVRRTTLREGVRSLLDELPAETQLASELLYAAVADTAAKTTR